MLPERPKNQTSTPFKSSLKLFGGRQSITFLIYHGTLQFECDYSPSIWRDFAEIPEGVHPYGISVGKPHPGNSSLVSPTLSATMKGRTYFQGKPSLVVSFPVWVGFLISLLLPLIVKLNALKIMGLLTQRSE